MRDTRPFDKSELSRVFGSQAAVTTMEQVRNAAFEDRPWNEWFSDVWQGTVLPGVRLTAAFGTRLYYIGVPEAFNSLIAESGASDDAFVARRSGDYLVRWRLRAEKSGGAPGKLWTWLSINENNDPTSVVNYTVSAGVVTVAAVEYMTHIGKDDVLRVHWAVDDVTISLQPDVSGSAFAPDVPSAFLQIQQLNFYGAP